MLGVRRQLNAEKVAAENAARPLEDAMLQRLSRRRVARLAADESCSASAAATAAGQHSRGPERWRCLVNVSADETAPTSERKKKAGIGARPRHENDRAH
jgi:hypothetical protein